MAAITIQQVEQNLEAMPEEQRAVAEEAMGMLSDDQLQSVLDVFDIQLSMEEAPQLEEAPMEEPMAEDELPTLPMPEEEAPTVEAAPIDQEMQELKLGGMPKRSMPQGLQTETIAGVIDDEAVPNTEANTVADKSETSLPEGAFVVSKAGVDEAGEIDLIERIIKPAIAALAKEGITIKLEDITQPAKQLNGGVDVALSEGEMIIPPALARKIGLGLLRKINDRGKKETEEKIQETQTAEQAPQEQAPQEQAQAPIRANKGGKIDKNLDMLARILFSEAGVEGKAGMQAVANVVMNRIEDTTAGFKNLKEANKVISQKGAFSSYGNKDYNNPSGPNYDIAKQVARQALSKEGLEDITGGALHFRNPTMPEKAGVSEKEEQDFFDNKMKEGRFILSKIIGKHHFYVDEDSNVAAGKDTKIESFADMQIPEEQQQESQPIGADTSSIDADPEQPPADDYESDAARRKRTIGEYTPEQRVPFAN